MKNFLAILLIFSATILTSCGNGSQSSDGEVFIVGLDDEYAPMGFRDENGNIVGVDIDLAKEAAKRLGVTFEFKPIDWSAKERLITSKEIDIIWNGLDINDERKEYMIFSKPYMEDRQIILVIKGNPQSIRAEADLAGKRVGTQAGSSPEIYIEHNEALKNSFAEFRTYGNYKHAFKDLEKGALDALICDEISSRYEIGRNPDRFEIVDVSVGYVSEVGIGFRKDDVELRDRVQKVFDDMVKDGTAKKISEKWFNADLIKFKR